jgi:hypothetical protein
MAYRLFKKIEHKDEWTINRFYYYQNMVKGKLSRYVNESALGQLNNIYY